MCWQGKVKSVHTCVTYTIGKLDLASLDAGSSGPANGSPEEDALITEPPKGLGPRIYVGGVSTVLSQTMIRNHFSQYGKVCP